MNKRGISFVIIVLVGFFFTIAIAILISGYFFDFHPVKDGVLKLYNYDVANPVFNKTLKFDYNNSIFVIKSNRSINNNSNNSAVGSENESDVGEIQSDIATNSVILSAPSNILFYDINLNSVVITWNDVDWESNYEIERKKASNGFTKIATLGPNEVSYNDSNLEENSIYYYKIIALDSHGNKSESEVYYITTVETAEAECSDLDCTDQNGQLRVRTRDINTGLLINNSYVAVYSNNIYIDGRSTPRGFAYFSSVQEGDYIVAISTHGYINQTFGIHIKPGLEKKISIYLTKENSLKFIFLGNQPVSSDIGNSNYKGRVDELNFILKDLGADGYDFVFPPSNFGRDDTHGYRFFQEFVKSSLSPLEEGKFEYRGLDIGIVLTNFNLGPMPPYNRNYHAWFSAIDSFTDDINSDLSNEFIPRVILDDFFAYSSFGSFSDPELIKELCEIKTDKKKYDILTGAFSDGSETPDSNFKLYALLYCGNSIGLENPKIRSFTTATTHERAFVDMLNAYPELRECFNGVYIYTSPKDPISENTVNGCIETIRPLNTEIIEGIYIADLSKTKISYTQRYKNINISRKTAPEGFSFYVLPVNDSLHTQFKDDDPEDLNKLYNYLKNLLRYKGRYIIV